MKSEKEIKERIKELNNQIVRHKQTLSDRVALGASMQEQYGLSENIDAMENSVYLLKWVLKK